MSSSGKGGSANQSKMIYGSGVLALGWGPWDWLAGIIHNGNWLFQGSLALTSDVTDLTGALTDPSYLAPGGYLRLRRGTETQPADFTGRRHKGTVTLECRHLLFGQDTGTAPNLQVIGGGLPRVPTTIVAAADNVADDGQVNPVACWAEILLDERGANLPEAVFDAPSWLAAGHWAWLHRDFTFVSPLVIEQTPLRELAKRLLEPFDGYCRWTSSGKLACRVYEWGLDPGGLATLDARHFTSRPKIPLGDWNQVKTEIMVSYTDRDYQFQTNTVAVPHALAAQIRQVDDQGSLSRPDVVRRPQAFRHGSEYHRRMGTAPSRATLQLRRPVLEALALGVGDKVKVDTDPEPGGTGLAQLCRIEAVRRDRSEVAQLEVVTDNLVPATVYTPAYAPPSPSAPDAPPLVHFLGVPLPPAAFGLPRAVAMLATRPSTAVSRFLLYFSDASAGDYDELGMQSGFAVRGQLAASIAAADSTLQLTELDGLGGPDAELAANTPGGNPTAAADNVLLALLCSLDGNGRIALAANGNPVMEFVSIQSRTLISGDTHSYTVLRGRLGTTAQAWGAGAVAWIVPREHLIAWRHELFDSLAGAPAFFRLVSATADALDDTIPVPQCSVNMLPNYAPMVIAGRPDGYYEGNLTNDRHTVASNAEGTPLAGELGPGGRAWTDVEAFAGLTSLTAVATAPGPGQFAFAASVASGSATLTKESASRLRVDSLGSNEAKITVTVDFEGTHAEQLEWIVWKNLSGGAYFLSPSASAVKRSTAGAYTPASVNFKALAKLSAAAPTAYAGRFKIAYWSGSAWIDDYVSAADESSKSYTPPAGVSKFRCQLYLAGSFSFFVDEEELPIVDDGSPGPTGPQGPAGTNGVDGINGEDGIFREFVWKRAASQPATPTGNGIPAGWFDDPPAGSDPLWMSVAKQELDGTLIAGETWSTPIRHDGPPGPQGPQGPQGSQGPQGPAGADGATVLGSGGGGGSASSNSYVHTSPATAFTFTSPGGIRVIHTRNATIANASGTTQTCYVGLFDSGGGMYAEFWANLTPGQSVPFALDADVPTSTGANTFYLKVRGTAGAGVAISAGMFAL